jgi:hypothetical protein
MIKKTAVQILAIDRGEKRAINIVLEYQIHINALILNLLNMTDLSPY